MNAKRKSPSQIEEERASAQMIAKAESFSAVIVLGGPGGRHAEHGLPDWESAQKAEARLNGLSRFGRRAVIYAVSHKGTRSTPCTPDLVAMAREINPCL